MSYVLEKLDLLVTIEVYPSQSFILSVSSEVIDEYINKALNEREAISILLVGQLFILQDEVSIKLFIKHFQVTLNRLIDAVQHYQNTTDNELCNKLYSIIRESLEELMSFVQSNFLEYFDLDQRVTDSVWVTAKDEMIKQFANTKQLLGERPGEVGIINQIFDFFDDFLSDRRKVVTYKKMNYRKELLNGLYQFYSSHKPENQWQSLLEVLVYYNFNHAVFFNFYCQQIAEQSKAEVTWDAKMNVLRYHRKVLLQMCTNPGMSLFPQLLTIQEQVSNWLNEEIIYTESEMKSQADLPLSKISSTDSPKISLNLSVAQLGLLIRVFIMDKTIMNANQMEVIRFFASHFKTYKTENISYGSLYGKYFTPAPSTIREVRNLLHRMVTVITSLRDN